MKKLTPPVFKNTDFLIEEKANATEFMTILAEKINKNLTLEKVCFYQALSMLIQKEEIIIDMNGRGKFLTHIFTHEENINGYWRKKDAFLLRNLVLQTPEFFEAVNEYFEIGDLLPELAVYEDKNITPEIKDPDVIRFWKHFDQIVKSKEENMNDHYDDIYFVLAMKYLRQAGDNLCLSPENVVCFCSSFRKYDVIEDDIKEYEVFIKESKLTLHSSKDMAVWEMFGTFKPEYMTKKQWLSFNELHDYLNKI